MYALVNAAPRLDAPKTMHASAAVAGLPLGRAPMIVLGRALVVRRGMRTRP
jgi:hypothetical protein